MPSNITIPKSLFVLFLSLVLVSGLMAMPQQDAALSGETRVVTDLRGRSVEIPEEITGILALGAGSLRLVSYLESTDRLVAVEDTGHGREKSSYGFHALATYRLAHPELRDLPSIGGMENHEGIIAASPDLVFSSASDPGQLDQLQTVLGIPVFGVDIDVEFFDPEAFYQQLRTLGEILGKEERADRLISGIKTALNEIAEKTKSAENHPRAYAGGMMYYGPADLLRTTGDYLPFDLTGTANVMPTNPAGNRQPYMTSLEDLIAAAPEYLFLDTANLQLSKEGYLANRAVLDEQVPAFRQRRIYETLVYKYYGTNWDNQLINVYFVGKALYPEAFEEIDLEEKAEEIWELFFGLPLDYTSVVEQQRSHPGPVDWFSE